MVAPIRYLSRRQQEQKIGILQNTENEKVLEVVGRVGIGTTIFDANYNLDVRGNTNILGTVGIGSTLFDAQYDLDVRGQANISGNLFVNGIEVSGSGGNNFSGITTFTSTENNILGNADTGAVQIDGGLGVNKNVTVGAGLSVVGTAYIVGVSTFTGAIDANGDLDVDGHTELDTLNVSAATTTTSLTLSNAGVAVTAILDEDSFISDRDDALATQQSIKSYVDAQITAQDLDFVGDTGTGAVDLDSQSLNIVGTTNEIETVGSGITLTIGLPDTVTITTSLTIGSATTITSSGINAPTGIVTANTFIGDLTGTATSATQLETPRTFEIAGDVVASPISFDGTGNVSLAATIQPNSVELGTDTFGDYVATIADSGDSDVVVNNSGTETAAVTLGLTTTGVTAGSYGSSTEIPTFTVDSRGRLTVAGTSAVGTALTVSGDSGSEVIDLLTESLTISGGTNLTSSAASDTITIDLDDNISLTNVNATGIVTANTFIGDLTGTATTATQLETSRTFQITGDVVASPISFDGTGNVSLAATIQPNSVGLGTDTFGDYVESIIGTANQITVTGGTGEGSTPTLSIPNQFTTPQDATVTRDLNVLRDLSVTGNITVGGTSATIFTTQLQVEDADIILGVRTDGSGNDISNDTTANHGGIAIASTEGNPLVDLYVAGIETVPTTYKKIMWFKAGTFTGLGTDAWLSNYAIGIGSTQFPTGTRLAAGNVQITEDDISVVRNINASGIITASSFFGSGVSTFAGDVSIADKIIHTGDTDTAIRFPANDTFTVETAGSERLRVTSAGDVGIGTDNPTTLLDIRSTNTVESNFLTLGADRNGADTEVGILFKDRNVVAGIQTAARINSLREGSLSNFSLVFSTSESSADATEKLRITSAGDVGIGTDNPTNTLEISKVDNHGITLRRPAGGSNPGAVKFEIHSNGAGRLVSERDFNLNFDTDNLGNQQFNVSSNGTERFRITSAGDVGIGTDNIVDQLTLGSSTNQLLGFETDNEPTIQSYNANLHINTAGNNVVFDGNGSVGIGTDAPSQTLDVNGDVKLAGKIYNSSNSEGSLSQVLTSGGPGGDWTWQNVTSIGAIAGVNINNIQVSDNYNLTASPVGSSSTAALYKDTDIVLSGLGLLGIGTNSPTTKLDVNGGFKISGVSTFKDDVNIGTGGTTAFFDISAGNIGINSATPQNRLDVIGNTKLAGEIRDANNSPGTVNYVLTSGGPGSDWSWQLVTDVGSGTLDAIIVREDGINVGSGGTNTTLDFYENFTLTQPSAGIASIRLSENINVTGIITATTFSGSGSSLTNIPNAALDNSTVSYGGVQLSLGDSDATPAFDLSDATNYPYTSLTGITTEIVGDTTPQLGGDLDLNNNDITGTGDINIIGIITATTFSGSGSSLTNIPNEALDNSTVSYGGIQLSLGGSDATPAFDLSDATNYPYTSLTGITTDIVGDTTPQLGGNLDLNSNDITGTGDVNITGIITATRFISTQTTGTAPFTVSSTTLVSNLNADLLDGQEGSYYTDASNINAGTIDDAYLPATISSDITGNAGTATSLSTARDFSVSGDATTASAVSFDGTANVDLAITIAAGVVTTGNIANGTILNEDINASAAISDTKLGTISSADKVSLSALNIDGGTDIGAPLVDGDLFIVDDGGGGTNRKADIVGLTTYTFGKVSGDIQISSTGTATIQANSVELTTDTTGNYVQSVTNGEGITGGDGGSEGASLTLALDINGLTNTETTLEDGDLFAIHELTDGRVEKITALNAKSYFSSGASSDKITEGNTEAEVVDTGSDGHFKVTTEGTERFRIIADGSVGIGTTTPEAKLQIDVGSGTTAIDIQGSEGQLFSVTNNLTSGSIFSVNDVSGIPSIDVDADGTIQLAPFGASEYVGIGTTNPTQKLDVNGNVAIGGSVYDANGQPGTNGQVLSNVTGFGVSWTTTLSNLVEDTTPQLGGDLDLNSNDITGTGNVNLTGIITATTFSGDLDLNNNDITGTGNVNLTGIITATTFSGDLDLNNNDITGTGNVNLTGIVTATGGFNIGIQSAGVEQTTGVITAINFIGTGNTFAYNAGTKTIDVSIEGGGGGGVTLDITSSLFV